MLDVPQAQKSFWTDLMVPLVMRLKWKLISVLLEIVLILTQDRCTVCVERTIGWKLFLIHPRNSYVTWVMWNLTSFHLETMLVSVQLRCMVCARHTIGLEIILDTPEGSTR